MTYLRKDEDWMKKPKRLRVLSGVASVAMLASYLLPLGDLTPVLTAKADDDCRLVTYTEAAKRLKPFFDAQCPVRLFHGQGWRIVKAREAGMDCCFGYRAENDRVAETLYGVRARGGMTPPRGLNGYRFERGTEGGYWILTQRV